MDPLKNTAYDLDFWQNVQRTFIEIDTRFVLCDVKIFKDHWDIIHEFHIAVKDLGCDFLAEKIYWKETFTVLDISHHLFSELRPVTREFRYRPEVRQIRIEFLEWIVSKLQVCS